MKKQSDLSRLLDYAGTYRILCYLSWVLAAAGALLALVPFWYIWRILREVIEVAPNYENAVHVTHYGWMAVAFAFAAVLTYIAGLMCSHLAAFRIATNLRLAMTKHIATLPLGEIGQFGSGKLRRTISETTGATETYLAHQLPDKARAVATIAGLLTLLLAFDWRLGLLSLVPVALAFTVMTSMTGKGMQEKMTQYQNALADMSGEAVEYVRGIPVVKTFGQTVFSFKKFKGAIDNYERWVIAYTKQLRWPMTFYTLAVNSVFVFLIAGGFLFSRGGADGGVLLNLLFSIIVTPVISLTLTKLMFMSENGMIVQDAITRIDRVLQSPSLSQPGAPKHPKDSSVTLDQVTFSYDGTKNAVENISLSIGAGQTVAFVGPSGGGKSTLAALIARFFDPRKWEVFYIGIIRSIFEGTWDSGSSGKAINYWWGFRSDAERLDYYETLPKGTQQLLDLLEKNLAANEFPIFPAGIFAQGHIPKAPTADTYTPKELMEMDWLGECVEGSLPRYDQLDVRTLGLLEINGLSSLKETTL